MKKRIFSVASIVMLTTFVLTGCHGRKALNAFEVPEEFDTGKNYTVSFWAKNDTNKTQTEVYKQAISDFEKLYPNIHVEMKLYTDYSKIYNDVITNISTNTTPNICITYPDHIATYMTGANTVVPLDKLMTDSKFGLGSKSLLYSTPTTSEIVPEFLSEGILGDAYYALPFMRSTEACYINKDYVNALGYEVPDVLTWDFIWEVSEKACAKNPDGTFVLNGDNVMIPFMYKSTDNMMISYLKQADAGYTKDDGTVEMFNDTTKHFLEEISEHAKTGAFSTFKISSYPANFLNAGQCIFAVDSTAGSTWMGCNAPLIDISADKLKQFETVVRPIPQIDVNNPKMMSQGPSICLFNKEDPGEVLASWLFAQYLLTDSVQISYATTEGYTPVTQKARMSAEYQDYLNKAGTDNNEHYQVKIDATKLLLENDENTFVTPVFNGSASVRTAAGALIESVVKSARRKQNIDGKAIDTIFTDTAKLYKLDQINSNRQEKIEFGKLPATSVTLITLLVITWILLAVIYARSLVRKHKELNKNND